VAITAWGKEKSNNRWKDTETGRVVEVYPGRGWLRSRLICVSGTTEKSALMKLHLIWASMKERSDEEKRLKTQLDFFNGTVTLRTIRPNALKSKASMYKNATCLSTCDFRSKRCNKLPHFLYNFVNETGLVAPGHGSLYETALALPFPCCAFNKGNLLLLSYFQMMTFFMRHGVSHI